LASFRCGGNGQDNLDAPVQNDADVQRLGVEAKAEIVVFGLIQRQTAVTAEVTGAPPARPILRSCGTVQPPLPGSRRKPSGAK